jgi:hypothetical protein
LQFARPPRRFRLRSQPAPESPRPGPRHRSGTANFLDAEGPPVVSAATKVRIRWTGRCDARVGPCPRTKIGATLAPTSPDKFESPGETTDPECILEIEL